MEPVTGGFSIEIKIMKTMKRGGSSLDSCILINIYIPALLFWRRDKTSKYKFGQTETHSLTLVIQCYEGATILLHKIFIYVTARKHNTGLPYRRDKRQDMCVLKSLEKTISLSDLWETCLTNNWEPVLLSKSPLLPVFYSVARINKVRLLLILRVGGGVNYKNIQGQTAGIRGTREINAR